MSTSTLATTASARPRFGFGPHLALLALLVAEVLYLTISFDTKTVDLLPDTWARFIGWAPQLLRISIAMVGVTLLVSGKQLWLVLCRHPALNPRWPAYLIAHLCALALFAGCAATLMAPAFATASNQGAWAFGFVAAGVATLALWALALFPLATWREAAGSARWGLVWGAVAGTAAWATGVLTEDLFRPLAGLTFSVVQWLVQLVYSETVSDPVSLVLGTPKFTVQITPGCSGYEGIGLILAFLGVYLWLSRRTLRFPNALILLPVGALAVWILNAVRIAVLIVIGSSGWRDVAAGGFHSQAGWLAFNAVGLGLVAIAIRGRYFAREEARADAFADGPPDPTAAYLGPFLAIVAASMVTGAVSGGFDWLYPVRVIACAVVLWTFRSVYTEMRWNLSWQAIAIGAATFIIWIALTPAGANEKDVWPATLGAIHPMWAGIWLAVRVIGYGMTVPLAEELAFRGYLMRRLMRTEFHTVPPGEFAVMPWIASSVLFGAMHGSMWIAGTIAGLFFGLAYVRRRSLGDAVQAHATTNLLLVIYAAATGRWSVWS